MRVRRKYLHLSGPPNGIFVVLRTWCGGGERVPLWGESDYYYCYSHHEMLCQYLHLLLFGGIPPVSPLRFEEVSQFLKNLCELVFVWVLKWQNWVICCLCGLEMLHGLNGCCHLELYCQLDAASGSAQGKPLPHAAELRADLLWFKGQGLKVHVPYTLPKLPS